MNRARARVIGEWLSRDFADSCVHNISRTGYQTERHRPAIDEAFGRSDAVPIS